MEDLEFKEQRLKALFALIKEFEYRYCQFRDNPWLGRQVAK